MDQKCIGDRRKPLNRLIIPVGNGFVRQVAACHDESREPLLEQQVVERRIGEHGPDIAVGRGHSTGEDGTRPFAQQHYGMLGPGQKPRLHGVDQGKPRHGFQIPRHHGEGLFVPVLASSQFRHGGVVGGVHRQVITAEPLDRDDLAFGQKLHGPVDGVPRQTGTRGIHQPQRRAAVGAGYGLSMESAIHRIFVLGPTGIAQGKARHGSIGPVIGNSSDEGIAGPTVGAVDERIAVAPVRRVKEFPKAVRTDIAVGGHPHRTRSLAALADDKRAIPLGCNFLNGDSGNDRQGRGITHNGGAKGSEGAGITFSFHDDTGTAVPDPSDDTVMGSQPEDEGAEPDALDDALNGYPEPEHHGRIPDLPLHRRNAVGQPCIPGIHPLAGPARNLKDRNPRAHPPGHLQAFLDIEIHVGEQVDLVEQHNVCRVEHIRIFEGFVLPLGNRQNHHFVMLSQIKRSGANQITHVFDEEEIQRVQIEFLGGMPNHVGIEMAAGAGVDLPGRHAGGGNALRIVVGLLVPFDDGTAIPARQISKGPLKGGCLAGARRTHKIEDKHSLFREKRPIVGGKVIIA